MDLSFSNLNFNSVENLPGFEARAAFTVNFASVFREDVDIVPTIVDDSLSYVPWGGDNNMPFDILKLIEDDETLAICLTAATRWIFPFGKPTAKYFTCIIASRSATIFMPVLAILNCSRRGKSAKSEIVAYSPLTTAKYFYKNY